MTGARGPQGWLPHDANDPHVRKPFKIRFNDAEILELETAMGEGEEFSVKAREILLGEKKDPPSEEEGGSG